ncbi:MAG: hypothetical protein ACYDH4_02710 [Candidatus Cryosericum sp.]
MGAGSSVQRTLFENDWDDFVALCYFEGEGDWLERCIGRAYLDMSRTLRRQGSSDRSHSEWRQAASLILRNRLLELTRCPRWDAPAFDEWHKASVELLQSISRERSVVLYVGQCQKWINMSIKYAIALGERRLPGFSGVYEVAHIPLDSIVLNGLVTGLAGKKMDALHHTWSRIPGYAEYFSCQLWVRKHLPGIPLEIEYRLWEAGVRQNGLTKEHGGG